MYLRYPNLLDAAVFKHFLRRIFPEEPEIPTLVDTWSDIGRSVSQEELSGRGRGTVDGGRALQTGPVDDSRNSTARPWIVREMSIEGQPRG